MAILELSIVTFLLNLFKTIDGEGSFYTNVGNRVTFDTPDKIEINSNKPYAINFRFADDEVDARLSSTDKHLMNQDIEIDLLAQSAEDAIKLKADVLNVIGADLTLGGLVIHTTRGPAFNEPTDQQGYVVANKRQTITIKYRTNAWSENED